MIRKSRLTAALVAAAALAGTGAAAADAAEVTVRDNGVYYVDQRAYSLQEIAVVSGTATEVCASNPNCVIRGTIRWGDGRSSTAKFGDPIHVGNGRWIRAILGNHTYGAEGSYELSVSSSWSTTGRYRHAIGSRVVDAIMPDLGRFGHMAASDLASAGAPVAGQEMRVGGEFRPDTNPGSGGFTYVIDFGDGSPAESGGRMYRQGKGAHVWGGRHVYAYPGEYWVTVTVANGKGHSQSAAYSVTVG